MLRLIPIVALLTACSGVSQSEFDGVQQRLDEARDQLAALEVEGAGLVQAEAIVGTYLVASDPFDPEALSQVYAEGVVVSDAGRGVVFRSRATALADLASGMRAFGIVGQRTLHTTIAPERAAVEWEMYGMTGVGLDWSFRGVSVLALDDGRVTAETLYYDLADAPWGQEQ